MYFTKLHVSALNLHQTHLPVAENGQCKREVLWEEYTLSTRQAT